MARKKYKLEEIVAKLRQVDVLTSQGTSVADAIRQIGVSEVTYYRWRQEYGGLKSDQVKRLKGEADKQAWIGPMLASRTRRRMPGSGRRSPI